MRDLDQDPYRPDEKRVVDFLWQRGFGGGDDPIGSILASHAFQAEEIRRLQAAVAILAK